MGAELGSGEPEVITHQQQGNERCGLIQPHSRLRRRSEESELVFFPEPHAHQPRLGLLDGPAVIGLEDIRDADHEVKSAAVVGAKGEGRSLQGLTELEQVEFSQPVALLKGGNGVLLLQERGGGLNGTSKSAGGPVLREATKDREGALNEDLQEIVSRAPRVPSAKHWSP